MYKDVAGVFDGLALASGYIFHFDTPFSRRINPPSSSDIMKRLDVLLQTILEAEINKIVFDFWAASVDSTPVMLRFK